MHRLFKIKFFISVIIVFLSFNLFQGQEINDDKFYSNNDDRHWLIEVPIWIPGFRGQLVYGDFYLSSSGGKEEREFDRLSSDSALEFYFVGRVSAQYDKFWFLADVFSGKVGSSFSYVPQNGSSDKDFVNVSIQGTIPRLVAGYSVLQHHPNNHFKIELIPYIGFRYINIDLKSEVFDDEYVFDANPAWFEPAVGLYLPINLKRFKIDFQVDFGGVKYKNSWIMNNRYRYRVSKLFDVQLGWTLIKLNHNDYIDNEKLDLNILLIGPTAGFGFRF